MTEVNPYGELLRVAEKNRHTRVKVRCARCTKLLAEVITQPWRITCYRCKAVNQSADFIGTE